jgi:hypothetical protein
MTFSIVPEKNSAAYSFIPLGASAAITNEYEYLIDIVYNRTDVISISQVTFNGLVRAQLELADNPFNIGDKIYFEDTNNEGYYTVVFSQGNFITIDLLLISTLGSDPKVYSYYGYKVPPNPQRGNAEVDLSPVLRNFTTENITATNSVYSADKTRFEYDVILGERSVYQFNFEDNAFTAGGAVGFIQTGLTINDRPPFEIGDSIFIQQEQTTITYRYFVFPDPLDPTINFFLEAGDQFGATPIFNTVGQTLLLNSQTAPQYNGFTTIRDVLSQRLRFNIPQALSAVAGNDVEVTGFVRPEYNGVHTVTDVIWNATFSAWIVRTDLPWVFNSPTIPGVITLASGAKTTRNNLFRINERMAFNARWDKLEYKKNYNEYVIDGICNELDKISTIYESYSPTYSFSYSERRSFAPIQPDAFCHLLVHNEIPRATEGLWVETFDKSDNQLSLSFIKNNSGDDLDYYTPIGLTNMIASPDRQDSIGDLAIAAPNTAYYVIWAGPEPCPEECCLEITICYEDRGSTVCFKVELEKINDNLYQGTDDEFGIIFSIQRTGTGSAWNLIQDDGDGTIVIAESFDLSDCPNDMNDWFYGERFTDYWGEDATLEISPGGHCEPPECCLTYTEKIPFLVDDCSKFIRWTIIFKDKRGSWAQYPFKMVSRKFIETERNNFYKQEGTFTDNDFFYDQFDRGEKSFATRSRVKWRLTSDWVTEQQNYIIEDLFKSTQVFIQNEGGDLVPVVLENKEYENKFDINEMLHNYQFDITISNDDWRY